MISALAAIGAGTLATVLFLGGRQFCKDWGKGYDAHKWGAY
jgi:hypothetical protein